MSSSGLSTRLKLILASCERPVLRKAQVASSVVCVAFTCLPVSAFFRAQPVVGTLLGEQPAVTVNRIRGVVHFGSSTMRLQARPVDAEYSPSGGRLAICFGAQPGVAVWDIDRREPVLVLSTGANKIAFSPSGKLLATGHHDGSVSIWDANTGEQLKTMEIEYLDTSERYNLRAVREIAFISEARVVTEHLQLLRQWEISTGKEDLNARRSDGSRFTNMATAMPLDGTQYACCRSEGFYLSDLTNRARPRYVATGDIGSRGKFAFCDSGRILVAAKMDIGIRSRDKPKVTAYHANNLDSIKLPRAGVDARLAYADPYRPRIFAYGEDDVNHLELWDLVSGTVEERIEIPSGMEVLAASPSGRQLTVMIGNQLSFMELPSGKLSHFDAAQHTSHVSSVTLSPDGSVAATASGDDFFNLWEVSTGTLLKSVPFRGGSHGSVVESVSFLRNGSLIACGYELLADEDSSPLPFFPHGPTYRRVARASLYSQDGHELPSDLLENYSAQEPRTLRFVEAKDGTLTKLCESKSGIGGYNRITASDKAHKTGWFRESLDAIAVCSTDQGFSIVDSNGVIKHWGGSTGEQNGEQLLPVANYSIGTTDIASGLIAYTPNGLVVSIFDTEEGRDLQSFVTGEVGTPVTSLELSQDGRWIAVANALSQLSIHEVATGKQIARHELDSSATCMAFSEDGEKLVVGCSDGTALTWSYRL